MQREMTENRLGTIHGFWLLLFKAVLASMPLVLAWGIWVTSNVFEYRSWQSLGPRFTQDQAASLETRVMANTEAKITILAGALKDDLHTIKLKLAEFPKELPPKWWEDWVRAKFLEHDERLQKIEGERTTTQ